MIFMTFSSGKYTSPFRAWQIYANFILVTSSFVQGLRVLALGTSIVQVLLLEECSVTTDVDPNEEQAVCILASTPFNWNPFISHPFETRSFLSDFNSVHKPNRAPPKGLMYVRQLASGSMSTTSIQTLHHPGLFDNAPSFHNLWTSFCSPVATTRVNLGSRERPQIVARSRSRIL